MNLQEAIKECKDNVEKFGTIFGNFNVIRKQYSYESVSDRYVEKYKFIGKIYHVEVATEPEDHKQSDEALKEILLLMCKTRKDRRAVEKQFKKGGLREWAKKFNFIK